MNRRGIGNIDRIVLRSYMKSFVFDIVGINFCFRDMVVEVWGDRGCDSDVVWEGDIPRNGIVQQCVELLPML